MVAFEDLAISRSQLEQSARRQGLPALTSEALDGLELLLKQLHAWDWAEAQRGGVLANVGLVEAHDGDTGEAVTVVLVRLEQDGAALQFEVDPDGEWTATLRAGSKLWHEARGE